MTINYDFKPLAEGIRAVAVAAIVATSRAAAEDAAEYVFVEYQELEAVTDMGTALDPGTPQSGPVVK